MDIVIESSEDEQGRAVLAVTGAIDLQTRGQLVAAGRDALATGPTALVLDLDAVTFIDSTGLGVLVELGHNATDGGGALVLRNPSPRVVRILQTSGLHDTWPTESV
jgi:anti-sigma B factor antagonist